MRVELDQALDHATRDEPPATVTAETVLAAARPPARAARQGWLAMMVAVVVLALLTTAALAARRTLAESQQTPSPSPAPSSIDPIGTMASDPSFRWEGWDPGLLQMPSEVVAQRCPTRTGEKLWAEQSFLNYGGLARFIPVGASPAPDDFEQATRDCRLGFQRAPVEQAITRSQLSGSGPELIMLCDRGAGFDFTDGAWTVVGLRRETTKDEDMVRLVLRDGQAGVVVGCELYRGATVTSLVFVADDSDADLFSHPLFHASDMEDLDKDTMLVTRLGFENYRLAKKSKDDRLDTRARFLDVSLPAPWQVQVRLPLDGGVLLTNQNLQLKNPVRLKNSEAGLGVPASLKILDAEGRTLRTCLVD